MVLTGVLSHPSQRSLLVLLYSHWAGLRSGVFLKILKVPDFWVIFQFLIFNQHAKKHTITLGWAPPLAIPLALTFGIF